MNATPSTNGRPAAKAKTKTTPRKRTAKPTDRRGVVYAGVTVQRFAQIEDGMKRMKRCPGFARIQQISDKARDLQALIVDTLQNYGEGTGSVTEAFLADYTEFDDSRGEIWDVLLSLAVDLGMKADLVDAKVPGIN